MKFATSAVFVALVWAAACGGTTVDDVQFSPLNFEDAGDGGLEASTRTPPRIDCTRDADCVPPDTTPEGCAEGVCNVVLGRCQYRAKDADGDGQRAAACVANGVSLPIPTGDDCDDADATTFLGAIEVCDGKDHTCGHPTTLCNCVNGTSRACYTGPAGTQNVAACKGGMQDCVSGTWGVCNGQVLPSLAMNAPPNAAFPCNGTNHWCDPAGAKGGDHCDCFTTDAPTACGSTSTCNPTATRTCDGPTGKLGTCLPAPIFTCTPGNTSTCATCSTFTNVAPSGTRVCTASCNFNGQRCTPNASPAVTYYPANPWFLHQTGSPTNAGNPSSHWRSPPGQPAGYVIYGPYEVLPAGRYRVNFSFYNQTSGTVVLDVVRNGVYSPAEGGLSPRSVTPFNAVVADYEYDFTINVDCEDGWELRVRKTDPADNTYFYDVSLAYLGP